MQKNNCFVEKIHISQYVLLNTTSIGVLIRLKMRIFSIPINLIKSFLILFHQYFNYDCNIFRSIFIKLICKDVKQ